MKTFAKTLFAFAFCLFFFRPLTADAATKTYTYTDFVDVNTFDAATYAAENPDVVAVIGNDSVALYNHYITAGCLEGRKGYSVMPGCTAMLRMLEVIDANITDDMSEEQKVFAIHEWMTSNIRYRENGFVNPYNKAGIEVAMLCGRADCNDYTITFATFMNMLGIKNRMAVLMGNRNGHCWNQVMINGVIYNIDVTWDAGVFVNGSYVQRYEPYKYYMYKDSEAAAKGHPAAGNIEYTIFETIEPGKVYTYGIGGPCRTIDMESIQEYGFASLIF